MIKLISLCLIAAGTLLIAYAVVTFFRKGLLEVWKDLKTSQQAQMELSIETVATDLYYNEILEKKHEEKPERPAEQGFRKNIRKRATDDSAILFEKEQQKLNESTAPLKEESGIPPAPRKSPTGTDILEALDAINFDDMPQTERGTAPLKEETPGFKAAKRKPAGQYMDTDILEQLLGGEAEAGGEIKQGDTDILGDVKVRESNVRGTDILYESIRHDTDVLK